MDDIIHMTNSNTIGLGILISGSGRTLENLSNVIAAGELNAEIEIVICSNPTAAGIERAIELGLNIRVVSRKAYYNTESFSDEIFRILDNYWQIELVCLAGFMSLLKIPKYYVDRVLNIHSALLPDFGGKGMYGHHVHEAVLKSGYDISGCTVHFVNQEYDKGSIILQREVEVELDDTPGTLATRVFEQECIAYPQAIRLVIDNMWYLNWQRVSESEIRTGRGVVASIKVSKDPDSDKYDAYVYLRHIGTYDTELDAKIHGVRAFVKDMRKRKNHIVEDKEKLEKRITAVDNQINEIELYLARLGLSIIKDKEFLD